jgi:hypothetical protein
MITILESISSVASMMSVGFSLMEENPTAAEGRTAMWISVATPSFSSLEQIDAVLAELGGPPDGLEARYVGTTADGELRIVSLWESQAHADRFFAEVLGPTIDRIQGPEPTVASEVVGIDVARRYARQPAA